MNEIWNNDIKNGGKIVDEEKYFKIMDSLEVELKKGKITSFFGAATPKIRSEKVMNNNVGPAEKDNIDQDETSKEVEIIEASGSSQSDPVEDPTESSDKNENRQVHSAPASSSQSDPVEEPTESSDQNENRHVHSAPAPVQEALRKEISDKEKALNALYQMRDSGFNEGAQAASVTKLIRQKKEEIDKLKLKLKRRESTQKANQRYRGKRKATENRIKEDFPEFASALKLRSGPGRPRIECDQPDILRTMLEIASQGSACGDRRRDDLFRTVKTLDQLTEALHGLGFQCSRSAAYLKLLPRDARSTEGKRHVNTIPVKLTRPQNDLRKKHPDRMFAAETSFGCDKIAQFLGPKSCLYLSQDDKAAVAIGKTAAKVQQPLLMNMRVRVRLSDHDFCVGAGHTLCPSVLTECIIDPKVGVTYSGTTYVAIRSSKHNNSTAGSHFVDLLRMYEICPEIFEVPDSDGEIKPVIIKRVGINTFLLDV